MTTLLLAAVALSLGLYFGERNTGIFHNHFIEFSSRPQLIEIKGKTFAERLEYLCTFNEVADTNVEAVFDLILDAAVRNNVPQEELPETLYLISDMEFNACVRNASVSNFASAKRRFAEHGYRLPSDCLLECCEPEQQSARDKERARRCPGFRMYAASVFHGGKAETFPLTLS